MRDEKLSGLLVENRRLQISPARGARGMRWWLTLGLNVWASLQAMSDIRKALVIDVATTERIVVATLSIGPTMAVIAVALGRRWWSLAGMAVAAALFVLDVAFLDSARFGSVAPMLTLVAVVVAGAGGFRRDRRVTMICLALFVSVKTWYLVVAPYETGSILLIEFPMVAFVVVAAWLLGNTVLRRQAAEARVTELAEQAQLARERERSLLARELHDVVAHELTIIAMQASLMRLTTDETELAAARGVIEETSRRALGELKRLLQVLRTSDGVPEVGAAQQASVAVVVDAVADQLKALGYTVESSCHAESMPRSVELAADRVLRESATNIVKHAPEGARVWVDVAADGDALSIVVANEDVGRRRRGEISSTHLGLSGLEERLSLLDGSFSAGREDGRWVVRSRIPYRPAGDAAARV